MTAEPERRARSRSHPRRGLLKVLLGVVLLALVFVLGLALGQAIEETPRPGGTQTLVRTLDPGTLPPVTRTVTVSTGSP